jgi:hypothetical protein
MDNAPGTPLNQRFTGLYKTGSPQVSIPDYEPLYNGIVFNLGMDVDRQPIYYDNIFVNLNPPEDLVRTEMVNAAFQQFAGGFMLWFGNTGDAGLLWNN